MESDFFDDDAPEAFCDYEGMYDREHAKVAALEAQLKQAKDGWDSCIADLREAGRICKATEGRLKALDWTPITAENLPKVGDQVFDSGSYCAALVIEENKDTDWIGCGFDLFRPVNLPHAGGGNV